MRPVIPTKQQYICPFRINFYKNNEIRTSQDNLYCQLVVCPFRRICIILHSFKFKQEINIIFKNLRIYIRI